MNALVVWERVGRPGREGQSRLHRSSAHHLVHSSHLDHYPHLNHSAIMTRERSLSGTIPSMETSHEELKDNTIIVGTACPPPRLAVILSLFDSPRCLRRSRKEKGWITASYHSDPFTSLQLTHDRLSPPSSVSTNKVSSLAMSGLLVMRAQKWI